MNPRSWIEQTDYLELGFAASLDAVLSYAQWLAAHERPHVKQVERASPGSLVPSAAMAEVLLFHHALGVTAGCTAFADSLRAAGHTVHLPDLYDGATFTDLDLGVAHAQALGDSLHDRAAAIADALPGGLVYAGLSLGVMPAQRLAQTRQGAKGALLLHAAVPLTEFSERVRPVTPRLG